MIIGLTGNIATGKSTVYRELVSLRHVVGFDADAVVHELYLHEEVVCELVSAFGSDIFNASGEVCRNKLRERFLTVSDARLLLEDIFHPRVRSEYGSLVQAIKPSEHLIADIPLLFEKELPYVFDKVIVVTCSAETQLKRLMVRSGLDRSVAREMINKQVALSEKVAKADYVLWNEGCPEQLQRQIKTLVHHLF